MRKLYLVRHGQPDIETDRSICLGRLDLSLNEIGKQQAADLAGYFSDKNITGVYHSTLTRCRQTALLLSNGRWPVTEVKGLEELDMGVWDGLTFAEIRRTYPEIYDMRGQNPHHIAPPGGENFLQGFARFQAALKGVLAQTQGDIVIVAHAGVNRVFLSDILKIPPQQVWNIPQPYTCINCLNIDKNDFHVEAVGCMPLNAPNERECANLLRQFKTPLSVISHCRAVTHKALKMADIARTNGHRLDNKLITAAALLHDVARGRDNHAATGGVLLSRRGYPKVAEIISCHHDLPAKDMECLTESTIVFLADKYVCGTEDVSLEERFAKSAQKCKVTEALAAHQRQYQQAIKARALLMKPVLRGAQ